MMLIHCVFKRINSSLLSNVNEGGEDPSSPSVCVCMELLCNERLNDEFNFNLFAQNVSRKIATNNNRYKYEVISISVHI